MGYTRSFAQLKQSVLVLGQYEGSADIVPVIGEYVNNALEESYNYCVAAWDDYYTVLGPTFTTVIGTDTYALPDDFYKLRKVEVLTSGAATDPNARWGRLFPVDIDDAHLLRSAGANRHKYRISVRGLTLVPSPGSGETLRIYYIPAAPQLELDTDTVQFDTPVEQKLVIHIALRDCYQRQDLPTQEIDAKIVQLVGQLRTATDHDAGEPFYLSRRTDSGDPYEDMY